MTPEPQAELEQLRAENARHKKLLHSIELNIHDLVAEEMAVRS